MNNKLDIEKVKIDGSILPTVPNNLYINFDYVENIVVRVNNNEINLNKNKLEALLMSLEKED